MGNGAVVQVMHESLYNQVLEFLIQYTADAIIKEGRISDVILANLCIVGTVNIVLGNTFRYYKC